MKKDKIMVFIPVYNCEKQITRVLSQINDDVLTYVDEIIVVNNLSTDNTVKVTQDYLLKHRELPCKIINNNANFNLGGSHKVAFNYALENDFDYVIVLHGDDQADIRDFLPILKKKSYKRADCVLGGRFESRSCLIGYSKKRILGNHVFNIIYSLAAGKSIRDMGQDLICTAPICSKVNFTLVCQIRCISMPKCCCFQHIIMLISSFIRSHGVRKIRYQMQNYLICHIICLSWLCDIGLTKRSI